MNSRLLEVMIIRPIFLPIILKNAPKSFTSCGEVANVSVLSKMSKTSLRFNPFSESTPTALSINCFPDTAYHSYGRIGWKYLINSRMHSSIAIEIPLK